MSQRERRTILQRIQTKNYVEFLKPKLFKCRACGSSFKSKQLLFKHVETHIGTPISCLKCTRCFNSRLAYTCHVKLRLCVTKLGVRQYPCDQCPKVFRFRRHIEKHLEGHRRNNCTCCELKLTTRTDLVEHLQAIHSIKLECAILFKCDYCEKRFVKKRSLYYHLKQHAENKIVCLECGYMCSSKEEHDIHLAQHEKDKPWQCEKCNDKFSRKQNYLSHMQRHDRYKCITCNTTHASRKVMYRHKQKGHNVQGLEPHFRCPHCPNAFYRRYALQVHLKKHSEDKPMHCKYCDKSFQSPYLYFKHCASTNHEIKSPAKVKLVCEICGKMFMKKYHLELHLQRIHDQNKREMFSCMYCGHKTTNAKNMERHVALHLETKKECICEQCGKTFYNLNTLKDHVSYVHIQDRQFKCNQCDKAFKRNSELIRHQTSHSEVRPHVCKTCGQAYKRLTHLKRHEKSSHGTVTTTRRVQRLKEDDSGNFIPIPEERKTKTRANKKKSKTDQKQVISLMDAHSGDVVTFEIPNDTSSATILNINNQPYSQDLSVTIPYTNMISSKLKSQKSSDIGDNITKFSNQVLDLSSASQTQASYSNILQEAIENSTTCDILLPENRQQNTESYLQNPYNYL